MTSPLRITITEIPHALQDYETVGNWVRDPLNDSWHISVSNLGDWRYAFLVAVHELVEMALCQQRGIPEAAVTQFDLDFEAKRAPDNADEPGHDPAAPYHAEHVFAEAIERQVAEALGVEWNVYDRKVTELSK